jgi:hypothetical protein
MEKCHVTGVVLDPEGKALSKATVRFTMTTRDQDGSTVIMPSPVVAEIGADGQVAVDLWPNARGHAGTWYRVSVVAMAVGTIGMTRYPEWKVVVPEQETADLTAISELVPAGSVPDGLKYRNEAQEFRNEARGFRDETKTYRDEAEGFKTSAGDSATAANTAAGSAVGAASAANTSAGAASDSAGEALGYRNTTKTLHDEVMPLATPLNTVADNIANVNKVAGRDEDIATVATRDADIGTVASRDTDIGKVAAIDEAVEVVASRDADIGIVAANNANIAAAAGIDEQITAVAGIKEDVTTAAENIAAIQAAPDKADLAAAWAEGTPPGAGTKSAKEHATDAAESAAMAAAATQIVYGVDIYNDVGVPTGVYFAERRAPNHSTHDVLYAEIINGDEGAEIDLNMLVDEVSVYGPVTVAVGTPLNLSGLALDVPSEKTVGFTVVAVRGYVTEIFVQSYGAVA